MGKGVSLSVFGDTCTLQLKKELAELLGLNAAADIEFSFNEDGDIVLHPVTNSHKVTKKRTEISALVNKYRSDLMNMKE